MEVDRQLVKEYLYAIRGQGADTPQGNDDSDGPSTDEDSAPENTKDSDTESAGMGSGEGSGGDAE